jgi:CubicO group peptidase (beta-lactamase class C family)
MRKTMIWRITAAALAALAFTGHAAAQPQAATTLPPAERMLFWPAPEQAVGFKNFDKLYAWRPVAPGSVVKALPRGSALVAPENDAEAFMRDNRVFGLLVLHKGQVRLEKYAHGLQPTDRWTSYSVVKSITSTLVGAAVKDGKIKSLDDLVTAYVPALKGTGYDGVTVRQTLNMSTGVRWDENYLDPNSDTNAIVRILSNRDAGGLTRHIATSPKVFEPDSKFDYNSGATHVLGEIVTSATGKRLSDYLSEKIWKPAGMETEARWTTDGGREFAGCCLNATLRDFGRFGLFALGGFKGVDGASIVPDGWLTQARQGSPGSKGYGYQWWITSPQTFSAIGVFGQMIYIEPDKDLVVVMLSAYPTPVDRAYSARSQAFAAAISRAVTP